jgi:hypothetical protein
MMSDKKRITIITLSVLAGTFLSYLLMWGRKGKMEPGDYGTLFVNGLLALAVVVGVTVIFKNQKDSTGKTS